MSANKCMQANKCVQTIRAEVILPLFVNDEFELQLGRCPFRAAFAAFTQAVLFAEGFIGIDI